MSDEPVTQKTALLVLGCPQVPVQTSIALYLAHRLRQAGITPVVAGNRSALTLLVVADPDRKYLGEAIDLDRAIDQITDKKRDFSLCFVFIHNDAGISYAATMGSISKAKLSIRSSMANTLTQSGRQSISPARSLPQKRFTTPCP